MNFFGHAVVASWRSADATFVLGAMLPDFASMIRARPPVTRHAALTEGVAFHHATDELFHDLPAFRELCAEAVERLAAAGLARGAARAAAHVGIEILLDGVLAEEPTARRAYLAAMDAADLACVACVWQEAAAAEAFHDLVTVLRARGVSRKHASPAVVARRVARALAPRPRLALGGPQVAAVEAWAGAARHLVAERTPEITAILAAYAARWSAST